MFDAVWQYLTNVLLREIDEKSDLEKELSDHSLYSKIKTTSYVPSLTLMEGLNRHVFDSK